MILLGRSRCRGSPCFPVKVICTVEDLRFVLELLYCLVKENLTLSKNILLAGLQCIGQDITNIKLPCSYILFLC